MEQIKILRATDVTEFTPPEVFSLPMKEFFKRNMQKTLFFKAPGESAIRMVNLS